MIKLLLLSGFLGAGKTTLMTNILNSFAQEKVGVIINEFGEAGVDGTLLTRDGIKMQELNNGSIFCACLKQSFLQSLIDMSRQDISHLFIEPSGLADPSDMGKILDTIKPMLDAEYDYRGVVSVIDAETFPRLSQVLPALVRQVEYCGAAIINKADLVDAARIEELTQMISDLNPDCEIIVTSFCRFDIAALCERLCIANQDARESTNTPETRLYSTVLKPVHGGNICIDALRRFVQELSTHTYRIKGFLPVDGGVVAVSAVGSVINIEDWTTPPPNLGLVVISAIGISIVSKITTALETSGLELNL